MKRKIKLLVQVVLASSLAFLNASGRQPAERLATVHVILVSWQGKDLGVGTVLHFIEPNEGAKDLATAFRNNAASNVPFGEYKLRISKKYFDSIERTIPVYQNEVWAVVQLRVGEENGPLHYTLSGRVEGLGTVKGPVWIRAQGLYSEIIADTQMTTTGNFQIAGIPAGIYLVSTREENHVLDMRSVSVPPPEQKAG